MTGPLVFIAHSVKRVRTLILTTGALLAGFQVVLVLVARSIDASGGFDELAKMLPPFAREMMGPSLASFMSFAGIVCLGYFHLVVMSALVAIAIAIATTPTSEIETGFIDLVLSRPVARHWVVTRTIFVAVLSIAVLLGAMLAGTWTGLHTLAPARAVWPSARLILSLAGNLALLLLCWSGVAMAIGAAARRRSAAAAITGLLAFTAFLLDYVGRLWARADAVARLSPFRYYNSFDLVMGNALPMKNVWVLGGIAAAGFAAAYWVFSRRDITH